MRDLHEDLLTCELFAGAFSDEALENMERDMERELVAADPHWQAAAAVVQFARNAREGWPEAIRLAQQHLRWWHDEAWLCQKAERECDELQAILTEITDAVERTVYRTGATPTVVEWCKMIERARRVLEGCNHDHV